MGRLCCEFRFNYVFTLKLLKQVVIPGAGVLPKLYPFMLDDPLKPATVPKVGPKSAKPTRAVRPKSAPIADFAPLKSGLVKVNNLDSEIFL
jgi:hypothetical protein